MFERFTDRARRVVVLAQTESRLLDHDYIGTEHLLLGLVAEGEGVAARALTSLGLSLDEVRRQVEEIIGQGHAAPTGHIPFTPRAKKVLELSLREALQLGHNYIGTEHLLLGLVAEGEGVAAQVLVKMGATLPNVRSEVLKLLKGYAGAGPGIEAGPLRAQELGQELAGGGDPNAWPVCPRCRKPLEESVGYRLLQVPLVAGEGETRSVAFAFCRNCGTGLGTLP